MRSAHWTSAILDGGDYQRRVMGIFLFVYLHSLFKSFLFCLTLVPFGSSTDGTVRIECRVMYNTNMIQ